MPDQISWTDSTGRTIPFTGTYGQATFIVEPGKKGFAMPKTKRIADEIPLQPGELLREMRIQPRQVDVPVYINTPTESAMVSTVRTLESSLNPMFDGTLKVARADGSSRQLTCRYDSGMEGYDQQQSSMPTHKRYMLSFKAAAPYWQDTSDTVIQWRVVNAGNFFPVGGSNFLHLNGSTVNGTNVVTNYGDVEAWPVWTIQGPGTNLILTLGSVLGVAGQTSPASIILNYSLASTDVITIDTRPLIYSATPKTVTKQDGTSLYADLDSASTLFALPSGVSNITVQLLGSNSNSYVQLAFRQSYLGS